MHTGGDDLKMSNGMSFSTPDFDQDPDASNCAQRFGDGGWWFANCHNSNLNGKYGDNTWGVGVIWYSFKGYSYSLPEVSMKIRKKAVHFT